MEQICETYVSRLLKACAMLDPKDIQECRSTESAGPHITLRKRGFAPGRDLQNGTNLGFSSAPDPKVRHCHARHGKVDITAMLVFGRLRFLAFVRRCRLARMAAKKKHRRKSRDQTSPGRKRSTKKLSKKEAESYEKIRDKKRRTKRQR